MFDHDHSQTFQNSSSFQAQDNLNQSAEAPEDDNAKIKMPQRPGSSKPVQKYKLLAETEKAKVGSAKRKRPESGGAKKLVKQPMKKVSARINTPTGQSVQMKVGINLSSSSIPLKQVSARADSKKRQREPKVASAPPVQDPSTSTKLKGRMNLIAGSGGLRANLQAEEKIQILQQADQASPNKPLWK